MGFVGDYTPSGNRYNKDFHSLLSISCKVGVFFCFFFVAHLELFRWKSPRNVAFCSGNQCRWDLHLGWNSFCDALPNPAGWYLDSNDSNWYKIDFWLMLLKLESDDDDDDDGDDGGWMMIVDEWWGMNDDGGWMMRDEWWWMNDGRMMMGGWGNRRKTLRLFEFVVIWFSLRGPASQLGQKWQQQMQQQKMAYNFNMFQRCVLLIGGNIFPNSDAHLQDGWILDTSCMVTQPPKWSVAWYTKKGLSYPASIVF